MLFKNRQQSPEADPGGGGSEGVEKRKDHKRGLFTVSGRGLVIPLYLQYTVKRKPLATTNFWCRHVLTVYSTVQYTVEGNMNKRL